MWTVDSYTNIEEYRLLYRQIKPYHPVSNFLLYPCRCQLPDSNPPSQDCESSVLPLCCRGTNSLTLELWKKGFTM